MACRGYTIVPLPQRSGLLEQYIFARVHQERGPRAKANKLFVANAPMANSREALRSALDSTLDGVESVNYSHLRTSSAGGAPITSVQTSYVTFGDPESASQALARPSWDVLSAIERDRSYSARLEDQYERIRPQEETLKREVDGYMRAFDEAEDEEERRRRELAEKVDEDGFRMVVRSKKRRTEDMESVDRRRKAQKKKYELQNFYRHQMREQKREALVKLREQFEEDKKRIARMKDARKFRPF